MENTRIILENGIQSEVNGIFYIFNSKYYFMYTQGEFVDNDYVHVYVVQVCKETQNTETGPVETGYMLGLEINDPEEWKLVQTSITKIVEDKKNNTTTGEIQYLPINMLNNLKIASKNKFKLMNEVLKEAFKIDLVPQNNIATPTNDYIEPLNEELQQVDEINPSVQQNVDDVIIDYRTKFFEEQEKNNNLQEQIKELQQKLDSIKSIL